MSRLRRIVYFVVAIFVVFAVIPGLIQFLTDWWWFGEVGYRQILVREITTETALVVIVAVVAVAILAINVRIATAGAAPVPLVLPVQPQGPTVDLEHVMRRLALPVAVLIGLFIGLGASGQWVMVQQFFHATPFGITDPIFGRDIGYYVFTLPGISAALSMLMGLVIVSMVMLFPIYWVRGDFHFSPPKAFHASARATRHVAALLTVFFILTALRLWFVDAPQLLYSTTGPLVGASYADVHATLPALKVLAVIALAAAVLVWVGEARGKLARYTVVAAASYIVAAAIGRGVIPGLVERVYVAPTELTRETPYLAYHLKATRQAWGIDSVDVRELGDSASLTLADIRANGPTIDNVRLWDRGPLLATFGQLQEIRTYYTFLNIDDERYWIDGEYRQVLLSPRELNSDALPLQTFINNHLTFTHGMGLTIGPVNQVTTEGLPVLFVKDLPPTSSVSLTVTRPQIYFGEAPYDYIFVHTRQPEFDHPSGEKDVYDSYHGKAGVPVESFWRRLVFAAHFGSSKILFSDDIQDSSRVLYYRNITERVAKALPFLRFDRDPYMVVAADGTLQWILDAYTVTDAYPYSEPASDGTTYMRNSVKVILDAYDGTMKAYISAPHDPLIETWSKIFPGLFAPLSAMPADLRAQLRYPDDLYRRQTALYATYHMDSPIDFYQREDQWEIPTEQGPSQEVPFMRHIIMRLPDEQHAEYIYMVPFTPRGKQNLAAWMVARNDGADYGKLRVYKLSRQSLVFGPTQIENRINQNTQISQQVSLWDQHGSRVVRGDLLVIPINAALLYVQPLYLQADQGRIPELKRVIVAYQDQVVMGQTLDDALTSLFGGTVTSGNANAAPTTAPGVPTAQTSGPSAAVRQLIQQARQHYDAAVEAQRNGDWTKYGAELKALGAVLQQLGPQN